MNTMMHMINFANSMVCWREEFNDDDVDEQYFEEQTIDFPRKVTVCPMKEGAMDFDFKVKPKPPVKIICSVQPYGENGKGIQYILHYEW